MAGVRVEVSKLAAESGSRRSMLMVRQFIVEAMVWGGGRWVLVFEMERESEVIVCEGPQPGAWLVLLMRCSWSRRDAL